MDEHVTGDTETGDTLRVTDWEGFVGQPQLKNRLRLHIDAATKTGRVLDHVLLEGFAGAGKTTLAHLIAEELCTDIEVVQMPVKPRILAGLLRQFDGGVMFLDEIHRLTKSGQEDLLSVLTEGYMQLDHGRKIYSSEYLCIIGATTEPDKVIKPLRDRFPIKPRFVDYNDTEMGTIVAGMADKVGVELDDVTAMGLGASCGGVPRVARDLVFAARDLTAMELDVTVRNVLDLCEIDEDGLNADHSEYMRIMDQCGGIGVGLKTLSTLMQLPENTIRELERLLMKKGFLALEKPGRELTNKGFRKVNPGRYKTKEAHAGTH